MEMPGIDTEEIKAEAEKFLINIESTVNLVCEDVLKEILDSLGPIDFRERSGLEAGEKIPLKVLVVLTVQEVLDAAKKLGVGLCRNADFIYGYNGSFWKIMDPAMLENFLGQAAERLGVEEITARYHPFRTHLYKQFIAVAYLPSPNIPDDVLINLQNGTYEINAAGQRLREFRPSDFLTYQLPFSYDENAQYPKWKQFLDRVLPDVSRQKVLAEFFAYIFTTNLKLEKTLMLFGTGANGKSVVFDVLTALLGRENISHYSLQSLTHEYHRAGLANKLLNYASEISSKVESDLFKKLSSGEPVEARSPYGKPFIMYRYAKLAFNANELPRDVEHYEAYFRRFQIIPFDVFIPEEERNINLAQEIIHEELSGVFNWVMDGLKRLLAQGNFSKSDAVDNALAIYRKESDSVALFIEEMGYQKVSSKEEAIPLRTLYKEYQVFSQNNGFRTLSSTNLRKRLEALGFDCPRDRDGRKVYAKKILE